MVLRLGKRSTRRSSRGAVTYHRLLAPISSVANERAVVMDLTCKLAAETRAGVRLLSVIEVPADLPLNSHMISEETAARQALAEAQAIGDSYGIASSTKFVRGRDAGEEIVNEAVRSRSQIIVISAARRERANPRAPIFGTTVQFVLKHAPCRVMIAAHAASQRSPPPPPAAERPELPSGRGAA